MTFLHPALLWLLPLAAIPIILHLLTLHRLKTVELSTFRFLFDSYIQQRRKMRFLEALLAMLRALFLLTLVMMICRPAVRHWSALFRTGSGRDVTLLLDCSASMNAVSQGKTAFTRAKEAALAIVTRLQPDDRLTMIRIGNKPEEVFSKFSSDVTAIREKIESQKTSATRANMFAALSQLFAPSTVQRGRRLVYLLTDCQATGWNEARAQGVDKLIPAETDLVIVNVGSAEPLSNLAVIGDAPRQQRAIVGLPIALQARVVNYSKAETTEATLSVVIDEKEIARAPLLMKPGEVVTRKVLYTPSEPGSRRGRFELASKAHDRFSDDDRFLFTLAVAARIKVLIVNGRPSADPLLSDALYLHTALNSPNEAPNPDVQEISEETVSPAILRDAGVVILANCGRLNPQQFGWLRDYVAAGGGLLILPGDLVKRDIYNQQLFAGTAASKERFIGVEFGSPEGDPEKPESYERLIVDLGHPVLSVFEDPAAGYFRQVTIKRRFPLLPVQPGKSDTSLSSNTISLAEFGSGQLAVVESRFGEGLAVVAGFPAHPKWTNLPLKAGEFVPLVLRLVSHVARRPAVEIPSVVTPDAPAEVLVTAAWAPATGQITDPAGKRLPLEFERTGQHLAGAFERTGEVGYYSVAVKGGHSDRSESETAGFAVNLAPEESDFTVLREEQLRELLPTANLTYVDASAEAQQLHGALGKEREIWRALIWMMFLIIGVEFTLATLGGQSTANGETLTVMQRLFGRRWA